jgi:ferredoxin
MPRRGSVSPIARGGKSPSSRLSRSWRTRIGWASFTWPLSALRRFDYHDAITESAYVAAFDASKCIACGTCAERCPFGAFEIELGIGKARFAAEKCFGCGLCVGTCPSEAITFVRR